MNCFNIFLILLSSIACVLSGTVYRVKVDSSLNVRKGPGIGYSIVDTLKNGEVIYATSVGNGWAKFYKGYARTTYLTAISSGTPYVTTTSVNCRTGPSTSYSIISTTSKGDTVTYFGKDPFSTWSVTNRGYMSSYYIKPKGQASSSGGSTGGSTGGNVSYTTIRSNPKNYGGSRSTGNIKYIVIHYTANDGDKAVNNGNYFKNNVVKASAHYFVDDTTIVQSVPDNYVAYSVGGSKYRNGGGRLYRVANNSNTLSIELCDTVKNGQVMASTATINRALNLVRQKMKQYGISKSNVIRHYDVNGKPCPQYWVNDSRWKSEFWNKI